MENKQDAKIKLSSLFGLRRKAIHPAWSNRESIMAWLQKRVPGSLTDLSTFDSGFKLDPYFRAPGTNLGQVITISNTLYTTNRVYATILDYLAGMYYWRYTVVPRKIKDSKTSKEYDDIYNEVLEVVDGINLEVICPRILLSILRDGRCYITTLKSASSKTVSTILLPHAYCTTTALTQHNTNEISFNMGFFDDLNLSKVELEQVFKLFPPEFKKGYDSWKATPGAKGWTPLDGRNSTAIGLNDSGFPTFLSVFYDIIDYKTYKLNELDRNSSKLDTIVAQEIDLSKLADAGIVIDEVQSLHEDMAGLVDNGRGSRLLTSLGKVHAIQLQNDETSENKVLRNSFTSIFDNAGLNHNLFTGERAEAIEFSVKRDLNFVWNLVEKMMNFYNLTINNLFNFRGYQASLNMLPVSPYNEAEKLLLYRQNATLGVGILNYVVAAGTKQIDLNSTLDLDEHLRLNERLRPLQSSHTQSSTGSDGAPKKEVRETDPDKPEPDDSDVDE